MSGTARILTFAAAMLLILPVTAQADSPPPETSSYTYTPNMEPLGASPHAPRAAGVWNTDLAFWGKTAYQGTYDGFRISDVSDPASPVELLNFDQCRGDQGDLVVWEDILVRSWNSPSGSITATCDGQIVPLEFQGLHIFDIGDPLDPRLVSSVNIPTCGSHTATGVPDLANNRLLVYSSPSATGQCAGFDIVQVPLDDPGVSTVLGRATTGRSCHDVAVILGDAMLAACAGGNGLTMMSIGGPRGGSLTSPVQLWAKSLAGEMVTIGHAATFSWDGGLVLFGHEPGGGGAAECEASDPASRKTLFILDAAAGTEVGRWVLPRPQTAQENCTLHNFNPVPTASRNVLVMGNYQAGIAVVDFTDPARPKEIAYADPAPLTPEEEPPSASDGGDWSSYWYDGVIYESDMTRGLITWLLNDPAVAGAQTLGHLNPQTQESTIPFMPVLGRCKGKAVTIAGGALSDVLKGTPKADVIHSGNGNDRISGGNGNDLICGGSGDDVLRGGAGNDILMGQRGKDTGKGGDGKDTFKGGPGKDKGTGFERGKP